MEPKCLFSTCEEGLPCRWAEHVSAAAVEAAGRLGRELHRERADSLSLQLLPVIWGYLNIQPLWPGLHLCLQSLCVIRDGTVAVCACLCACTRESGRVWHAATHLAQCRWTPESFENSCWAISLNHVIYDSYFASHSRLEKKSNFQS